MLRVSLTDGLQLLDKQSPERHKNPGSMLRGNDAGQLLRSRNLFKVNTRTYEYMPASCFVRHCYCSVELCHVQIGLIFPQHLICCAALRSVSRSALSLPAEIPDWPTDTFPSTYNKPFRAQSEPHNLLIPSHSCDLRWNQRRFQMDRVAVNANPWLAFVCPQTHSQNKRRV